MHTCPHTVTYGYTCTWCDLTGRRLVPQTAMSELAVLPCTLDTSQASHNFTVHQNSLNTHVHTCMCMSIHIFHVNVDVIAMATAACLSHGYGSLSEPWLRQLV
jgi:hypothetical protein